MREVELHERRAQVQAGATGDDRGAPHGEDVVDRPVGRSGVGPRGGCAREREVADEMVGDLTPLLDCGAVRSDLQAAVALERIGDDDFPVEGEGGVVREGALPGCRRTEQREDLRIRRRRRPSVL